MTESFKVTLEVTVGDDLLPENPNIPMTQSHRNALMREQVWLRVSDALQMQGLEPHQVLSVVKVQRKGNHEDK